MRNEYDVWHRVILTESATCTVLMTVGNPEFAAAVFRNEVRVKNQLQLPRVTLAAVASTHVKETVKALRYSMRGIAYGQVLLLTDREPENLPTGITFTKIPRIDSIDGYNRFMLFELYHYIETPFVMVVQWDGFVVNPGAWQDAFLQYDYTGAPWPVEIAPRDETGRLCRVGNGGASLRSSRLLALPAKEHLDWNPGENEDIFLCCQHRPLLEEKGLRIAPAEVACHFAHERRVPENEGITPFAFHQWEGHNAQYPKFHKGWMTRVKQAGIGVLIRLHCYDRLRQIFLQR